MEVAAAAVGWKLDTTVCVFHTSLSQYLIFSFKMKIYRLKPVNVFYYAKTCPPFWPYA